LQNSINKYGIENFIFVIVEYCDSSQLLVQEQYYLDWLFGLLPELRYNFAQDATAPMSGRSHSEESKATISEAMSGENHPFYGKRRSDETKARMSEAKLGENHPMFGKTHSFSARMGVPKQKLVRL